MENAALQLSGLFKTKVKLNTFPNFETPAKIDLSFGTFFWPVEKYDETKI
jgi:hypothetical protein